MYHQINDFVIDKLSKQLTGFRKNCSTQHNLHGSVMDLSTTYDTLNHDLLIAKLGA